MSALQVNNPQEGLMVHRSELGKVFLTDSPLTTPVERTLSIV